MRCDDVGDGENRQTDKQTDRQTDRVDREPPYRQIDRQRGRLSTRAREREGETRQRFSPSSSLPSLQSMRSFTIQSELGKDTLFVWLWRSGSLENRAKSDIEFFSVWRREWQKVSFIIQCPHHIKHPVIIYYDTRVIVWSLFKSLRLKSLKLGLFHNVYNIGHRKQCCKTYWP